VKILILFDLNRSPGAEEDFSTSSALLKEEKKTEADLFECLKRLGHEVATLGVFDNVRAIFDKVDAFQPDVVFNVCESFHSDRAHEPNIPALLDLMRVRYTGAGPDALMLCKDKALAKKLLTYHQVRVAKFVVSQKDHPLRNLRRFQFPAFIKPVNEESSDGISKASFAKSEAEALERAKFIHEKLGTDALVEEYIDGRELTVGVLGNTRLTVFPPQEIFFGVATDGSSNDAPRFATAKAKWDEAYRKKWGIHNGPAGPLAPGLETKLEKIARRVYRVLQIRGLGRLDLRVTEGGDIVVIEANPNPSLAKDDDFVLSAARAGIDYDALIQKILENAVR
jgi:D-alanine-D-alanine ligase